MTKDVEKLFEQEVPELNDGNIEVKAVARDAGSRAKIAIYSRRDDIDIIGSFIGIRGSRVQAVSSELRGEKIDIIKWSSNIAELVISSLTPAKVSKVVVDEEFRSQPLQTPIFVILLFDFSFQGKRGIPIVYGILVGDPRHRGSPVRIVERRWRYLERVGLRRCLVLTRGHRGA